VKTCGFESWGVREEKFTGNSFFGRGTGIESYLLSWKLLARQVRVVAKEKEKEGGRAMAG